MSDSQRKPRYILRPVVTPVAGAQPTKSAASDALTVRGMAIPPFGFLRLLSMPIL